MSHPEDLSHWLALLQAPGLGAASARVLAHGFGGPAAVLRAADRDLELAGVDVAARRALRNPDWSAMDRAIAWLAGGTQRSALTFASAAYPELLRALADAPPVLFVEGDAALLGRSHVAVVGSRNPTRPGEQTAHDFARALVGAGLGVVSGLATGIDAAAHRGAIAGGGVTIAVAGHGLDSVYPRAHAELARQVAGAGARVSEFVPGTAALREHFPRRNRIISGLSLGVLVVEAAVRSGSLITARLAAEQGREVFAIPGSIHNPMVRGCHALIRQGAKLVDSVQDLLEELGWDAASVAGSHAAQTRSDAQDGELDGDYVTLLDALGHDPAPVDVLVTRTGLTPQALSSMLLRLELRGIVHPVQGMGYVRAAKRE
jgi:DNA processing protein